MGGAVRAVSGERPDGGAILRTGTCVGAQLLLLGKACRIRLGQDVFVDATQRVAAGSPVREARAHGGRDLQRRPGPFLLRCGGGGVGAGRLPGRDSLSGRVPPAREGGTLRRVSGSRREFLKRRAQRCSPCRSCPPWARRRSTFTPSRPICERASTDSTPSCSPSSDVTSAAVTCFCFSIVAGTGSS